MKISQKTVIEKAIKNIFLKLMLNLFTDYMKFTMIYHF